MVKEKRKLLTKLYDKRDDFSFRIVNFPSICGSSPSAPLPVEFSFHNAYVMPLLAVTTHTFSIVLDFWQLGIWNRVLLLQDWSHYYRSFIVVIMSSWIVTVYASASWKLICLTCHIFPILCRYSIDTQEKLIFLWMNNFTRRVFLEKLGTPAPPVHLDHNPCFWLIAICSFTFVTLFVLL